MKRSIFILIFLLLTLNVFAQKIEKVSNNLYKIEGDIYTAQIGDFNNGYLQSLIVNGQEFLDQDMYTIVDRFAGFKAEYIYNGVTAKSLPVKEIIFNDNKFICKTDGADVVYTFYNNKIDIDIDFFDDIHSLTCLFKAGINNVIKDGIGYSNWRFYPNVRNMILCIGKSGLKLDGDCVAYGSWEGREVLSMNKHSNHLSLEPVILTDKDRSLIDNKNYIFPNEDIVLYSPKEYEVFQRYSKDKGVVYIEGKVSEKVETLSYRIEGKDYKNKTFKTKWIDLPLSGRSFAKRHDVPAGGWYKIELKGNDNIIKTVQKFGVGEIIVGTGQSNSTNCGQFYTKTQTGMVSSTDGIDWKLGDDPQIGVSDSYFGGGSLYPALGDALYKEFNVPIGIASIGCAGASINLMIPGEWVYNNYYNRMAKMGKGGFRAVIWIQGETDVVIRMPEEEYTRKLESIIESLHRDLCWNFPWFVAKVSYLNNEQQSYEPIRKAQEKVISDGFAFMGVDMDTIGPEYRDVDHKGVHMTPEGLKKHGEMWAEILSKYIKSQL